MIAVKTLVKDGVSRMDKPIKGVYVCTNCMNVEHKEREVYCWHCGKGEMVYRRITDLPEKPLNEAAT